MNAASAHHHYNPDWLDDDTLLANFVARQEEFGFLRNELARAPLTGTVQHHLVVGLRGAGKTTLLKRLAVAIRRDDDLKDHLIALSFPEELYQVKNLADFWWAACDALTDELEHLEMEEEADCLIEAIEKTKHNETTTTDAGHKLLLQTCADLKRRPVLLVDNLDFIFQRIDKKGRKLKDPHAAAYWELREALSTATSPIVIGGSVRLSEPFTGYDKAFYDFFIPKRLGKLPLAEVRIVLERLADAQGIPEIKQRLHERPSRIESLFELTGGNPRALGLIFELLRLGPNSRAVEDFERLMDITTPYYKARFEDLSEQAQVVMHALAVRRPGDGGGLRYGHTASEIGTFSGLPTGTVSTQLNILENEGLVEKSAAHGRTQYRIAEQLFRLWLQMRSTRRIRQNVIGLTEFLEAMFDFEELQAHVGDECGASAIADSRYAFAVAGAAHDATLRKGLEAYGADQLLQHLKVEGGEMADYLPAEDMAKEVAEFAGLREQLQKDKGNLTTEEQDALLGSLELKPEQKQAFVQALCKKNTAKTETEKLRNYFARERQKLLGYGLQEQDLPLLYNKRARGLLPLPELTPTEADSACIGARNQSECWAMIWRLIGVPKLVNFTDDDKAQAWLDWGMQHASQASSTKWANVTSAFRSAGRYTHAQKALNHAIAQGESSRAWCEAGALLNAADGDTAKIEAAYRRAIELDPNDALPHFNLGRLLTDKLKRHEEAESAYRKSLELDPENHLTWQFLGLLALQLKKYGEAESAFRKAIEIEPSKWEYWFFLGDLLADMPEKLEEAKQAARKALELKPDIASLWAWLGALLLTTTNSLEQAEIALRKSIELDAENHRVWGMLGLLLFTQSRNSESMEATRKTIELNPKDSQAWLLSGLLHSQEQRFEEALNDISKAEVLNAELSLTCKEIRAGILVRICTQAAQHALMVNDTTGLLAALKRLLNESPNIAASLIEAPFIEDFLTPLLATPQHAQSVLDAMRELGYDKHARPLLLAFEAALHKRSDMLDELEPEIQGGAKHMYERLMGKPPKKKSAAKPGKGKTKPA